MQSAPMPKVGVLLITTSRFHDLGQHTERGAFYTRKDQEASDIISQISTFSMPVFDKVVYTRNNIIESMHRFEAESVDMVLIMFLSWSDDFAWIRFLRDMKPIPILFASLVRQNLGFQDSLNDDRFVEFLSAGSLVGSLEASGSAGRFDRPMMKRMIGTLSQIMHECRLFAQASALRTRLKHVNFGLLPSLNEVMWSTYVDPFDFFMLVGPEIRFLSVVDLAREIQTIEKEKILCIKKNLMQRGNFKIPI